MAEGDREHAVGVAGYGGDLADLATEVGRMRYDAVAAFLKALSAEMAHQAQADKARGRLRLACHLDQISGEVAAASLSMREIWRLCAKHIPDELAKIPEIPE